MVQIAQYDTLPEANAYANALRRAGIICHITSAGWNGEMIFGEEEQGPYLLSVRWEDEEDALLVLESANFIPEKSTEGQSNMLVGAVIGGVGLLTSFGEFVEAIPAPFSWIPYGMIIAGIALFWKGTQEEKESLR